MLRTSSLARSGRNLSHSRLLDGFRNAQYTAPWTSLAILITAGYIDEVPQLSHPTVRATTRLDLSELRANFMYDKTFNSSKSTVRSTNAARANPEFARNPTNPHTHMLAVKRSAVCPVFNAFTGVSLHLVRRTWAIYCAAVNKYI
ncbi:hypothetical protein CC78DRAFT_530179 [Lojkania enalia]|uniref:Uncharacterized protein n=1 Tax=Lojkania enalia TaxID=147567 RepID=A0A9P4N711_9PLEO|nr:hypothetical protein CC78DRAFT_530179 [Didymosphaeria enalia]